MIERESFAYSDLKGVAAQTAFVRRGKKGHSVVLIHGVGMSADIWYEQIDSLAKDHKVAALDMLGHGRSSLPPEKATLEDYAFQVAKLVERLGDETVHVVGHSMGALVALEFAIANPRKVESVTAMNAVFCRSVEQRSAVLERATKSDNMKARDWRMTIARWFGDPVPGKWGHAADNVLRFLESVDEVGYQRSYRVFATSDAVHTDSLRGLPIPALFLTGADDPNSTPEMSREMARRAPFGLAKIIPGERHMMGVTAPQKISEYLRDFFDLAAERAEAQR